MVEYLSRTQAGVRFEAVIRAPENELHIPYVCDIEVMSTVRRALLRGEVSEERVLLALGAYVQLPLTRHQQIPLLGRILELRNNFSAYDATYVALAEQLDAGLITADERLARAVRVHTQLTTLP